MWIDHFKIFHLHAISAYFPQGMLSKIFVKAGQEVKKNTPLFTIEAMKMETTITANKDLKIKDITLKEGTLVESDDLVMEVE